MRTFDPKDGWEQTSSKYRTVARLPAGKTGLEALDEVAPKAAARLRAQAEQWAANEFRRMYADGENKAELTEEEFAAFKSAGGKASF